MRFGRAEEKLVGNASDFIADNPDLMIRLRDAGLAMVLSGYETNDDKGLAFLRKDNTRAKNKRASVYEARLAAGPKLNYGFDEVLTLLNPEELRRKAWRYAENARRVRAAGNMDVDGPWFEEPNARG